MMPVDQLGFPSLGPELQKFPHRGGFLSAQTCEIGSPGALLLSVLGFKAADRSSVEKQLLLLITSDFPFVFHFLFC